MTHATARRLGGAPGPHYVLAHVPSASEALGAWPRAPARAAAERAAPANLAGPRGVRPRGRRARRGGAGKLRAIRPGRPVLAHGRSARDRGRVSVDVSDRCEWFAGRTCHVVTSVAGRLRPPHRP